VKYAFIIAALVVASSVALCQKRPDTFYKHSTTELVAECRNISVTEPSHSGDSEDLARCMSYLIGVIDGSSWGSHMDPKLFSVCIPVEVTQEELIRVFLKYADQHPENLHWLPVKFVTEAFKAAYPCPAG
jgi:hypothetical protein